MPFSFSFTGTFDTLGNFFSRLESFVTLKGDQIDVSGRLLRVESLSSSPPPTAGRACRPRSARAPTSSPRPTEVAATPGTTTPSTTTAAAPSTGTTPGASGELQVTR